MLDLSENHSRGTLLLVDDEINIVNSLKRIFIPLNYHVLTAYNGFEGLNILEKNDVDIIISDMRMPEMDGADFLKRAADKWPDTNRILLTGYADLDSTISAINDGHIDHYITKPWQQEDLEKIIQNIMEKRDLIEKNKQLQIQLKLKNEELIFFNKNLEEIVKERTIKLEKAYEEIKHGYSAVIQILSSLIEQHEKNTNGISQRVAKLCQLIAEKLGLPAEEIQTIHHAGLLHTIGKIGLPDSIRSKSYQNLLPHERTQFEKYPLFGGTVLLGFPSLKNVAALISTHRELVNGKGYPNKLKRDAIPIGSRILSMVVDYEELQAGLLIPETLSAKQALQYIHHNMAHHYDKELIEFLDVIVMSFPDGQEKLKEVILTPGALKPGMVLARDFITDNGLKLLSKGHILTEQTIETFRQIGKISLHITVD